MDSDVAQGKPVHNDSTCPVHRSSAIFTFLHIHLFTQKSWPKCTVTVDCHLLTNVRCLCSPLPPPPTTDTETKGMVRTLRRTPTSEKPNFEQVTHSPTVRQYQVNVRVTNQLPAPLCDTSERLPKQARRGRWDRAQQEMDGWVGKEPKQKQSWRR